MKRALLLLLLSASRVVASDSWPSVPFATVRGYAWPEDQGPSVILPGIKLAPGVINKEGALLNGEQIHTLRVAVSRQPPSRGGLQKIPFSIATILTMLSSSTTRQKSRWRIWSYASRASAIWRSHPSPLRFRIISRWRPSSRNSGYPWDHIRLLRPSKRRAWTNEQNAQPIDAANREPACDPRCACLSFTVRLRGSLYRARGR
jgi:hypothetical protein